MNVDTLYGFYLLTEAGLVVHNPKWVDRYGKSMRCLLALDSKPEKKTTAYLRESYKNSAESAKFFATYPEDLSGKSITELRRLRAGVSK